MNHAHIRPPTEDRDFQLISWGKDRLLKIRPVDVDTLEKVGYRRGGPIECLVSRRGAADISYATAQDTLDKTRATREPLQDGSALVNATVPRETVMTRGAGPKKSRPVNEDQMEWFMNVHQVSWLPPGVSPHAEPACSGT